MRLLLFLVSALLLAENIAANFGYLHRDPHSQIAPENYWSQFQLKLLGESRFRRSVAQSGSNFAQSGSSLTRSGSNFAQSGSSLTRSGSNFAQSGSSLTQSGSNFDHDSNAAFDERTPHHEHVRLFDHMMAEINKGHITADKLSHWWAEIHEALNSGEMTMDEFHQLVNALSQAGVSGASHEGCCPLG